MSRLRFASMFFLGAAWCSAVLAQEAQPDQQPREPGMSIRCYDIGRQFSKLMPLVPGQTPNVSKVVPVIDLDRRRRDFGDLMEFFLMVGDGFLEIPNAGQYEFELTSDDGSKLWIDGKVVVDNDMEHSTESKTGKMQLSAGLHPIELRFFQGVGDAIVQLKWKPPGQSAFSLVPTSALSCQKGEVRVTSPGQKKLIMPLDRGKPGDGRPLEGVHPSYDLAQARPKSFKPRVGGIDWLSDGRMVMCAWDADGSVFLLTGAQGSDPEAIKVKRIAAGLAEPLGVKVVNDHIYVLQKQELTELVDLDGDDIIDEYRCVCSGWNVTANFHEFAFGLAYKDGFFYATLAIAINPGGRSTKPQIPQRGSVVKISTDGTFEILAQGLRTPNGIGLGVDNEIFVCDNQGDWVPVSKMVHVKQGAFYGSQAVLGDASRRLPVMPPTLWLPQGEIGNSPSEILIMKDGPYAGQMIHCEVTHGGVKRDFIEKINGEYQGCVFRFTQGLEAGINRISWGPDGALYCGGIGSTGDWGQEGKLKYGLQRIKYNGKPTFEMLAVRAMSNGMEIEFTEPLAAGTGWDPDRYAVEQYWYKPTTDYGGEKQDRMPLPVRSANVSSDRRRVFLEIEGMKPGNVVYIRLIGPWKSEASRSIWSTEAWYTLNAIPTDRAGTIDPHPPLPPRNVLTEAEAKAGWRLLFDGKTTKGWRGFKKDAAPSAWKAIDECLTVTGQAGDLITDDEFDNFELSLEWKVAPGGNSGIIYRVAEDGHYVWETGPEMQVLDNERHPDGEVPNTSAGSLYGLYAPNWDESYPAGVFNAARIIVNGNHVEHWLNGVKLFECEIGSADWNQRIANSKFKDMPRFATMKKGHIALQDHGDRVWYRNIKIRPLPPQR